MALFLTVAILGFLAAAVTSNPLSPITNVRAAATDARDRTQEEMTRYCSIVHDDLPGVPASSPPEEKCRIFGDAARTMTTIQTPMPVPETITAESLVELRHHLRQLKHTMSSLVSTGVQSSLSNLYCSTVNNDQNPCELVCYGHTECAKEMTAWCEWNSKISPRVENTLVNLDVLLEQIGSVPEDSDLVSHPEISESLSVNDFRFFTVIIVDTADEQMTNAKQIVDGYQA